MPRTLVVGSFLASRGMPSASTRTTAHLVPPMSRPTMFMASFPSQACRRQDRTRGREERLVDLSGCRSSRHSRRVDGDARGRWCPQGESDPRFHLERVASWATRRWGHRSQYRGSLRRPATSVRAKRPRRETRRSPVERLSHVQQRLHAGGRPALPGAADGRVGDRRLASRPAAFFSSPATRTRARV